MPAFVWGFIMIAGLLCIAVECAARLIAAIAARHESPELNAALEKLVAVRALAKTGLASNASPETKDAALSQIQDQVVDRSEQKFTSDAQPSILSFLTTIGTKNVFLGVGLALLLIPVLVGQGVSIEFNGNAPSPSPSSSATP